MAQGLQVFDANGRVLVDTNKRIGKILGQMTIYTAGSGDRTVTNTDDRLTKGKPFYLLMSEIREKNKIFVDFNGNQVTLRFGDYVDTNSTIPYTVLYGVY